MTSTTTTTTEPATSTSTIKTLQGCTKKCRGRATWIYLHTTGASYPESPTPDDIKQELEKLNCAIRSLRCDTCYEHAISYIQRYTPDLSCNAKWNRWMFDFHCDVNKRIGYPNTFTWDDYVSKYTCKTSPLQCEFSNDKVAISREALDVYVLMFVIFIVIWLLFVHNK